MIDRKTSLGICLAEALPTESTYVVHHLSSAPTTDEAIFAPLPGQKPEETYRESHFLSIAVENQGCMLQIFAIEVLVYTTQRLTTLFISKADSTGYLYLLGLPKGTPSPLRTICTVYLEYLIGEYQKADRRLVLSLFARAQNQYLFPGSVENNHKHVLDDRGLIRWWCNVIEPLIGSSGGEEMKDSTYDSCKYCCTGYLRVPGCDVYQTRAFLPATERRRDISNRRWIAGDPLHELAACSGMPERCLIPRFPDDPKARFVIDLDDELPEEETEESPLARDTSLPSQLPSAGRWRSVRSLDQFWEMMSFRQECAAGRLVGFLWLVITASSAQDTAGVNIGKERPLQESGLPTPLNSQITKPDLESTAKIPMSPSVQGQDMISQADPLASLTNAIDPNSQDVYGGRAGGETKRHCATAKMSFQPPTSRGEIVLEQKDYDHVCEVLSRLDYADVDIAKASTKTWIENVAMKAGVACWGQAVKGQMQSQISAPAVRPEATASMPVTLNAGLVRKKKRAVSNGTASDQPASVMPMTELKADLIKKKVKIDNGAG